MPCKDLDFAIVHQGRYGDSDLLLRMPQHLVEPWLQVEQFGCAIEARHHRLEGIFLVEETIFVRADYSIGRKSKVGCHEWLGFCRYAANGRLGRLSLAAAARSGELIKDVFDTADPALDANALRNIP